MEAKTKIPARWKWVTKIRLLLWRWMTKMFAPELLREMYLGILGREPDLGGIIAYIEKPRRMGRPAAVIKDLLDSEEFQRKMVATLSPHLVGAAYAGLLGRQADPDGLAYRSGRLAKEQDLAIILREFVQSREFQRRIFAALSPDLVGAIYEGLLGRRANPVGLAEHSGKLAKEQNLAIVLREFVQSREFQRKIFAALSPALVTAAYKGVFGNEPEPREVANRAARLAREQDLAIIVREFIRSKEFQREISLESASETTQRENREGSMMNDVDATVYASAIKSQIYPWGQFTASADTILSQFQQWNEQDPPYILIQNQECQSNDH